MHFPNISKLCISLIACQLVLAIPAKAHVNESQPGINVPGTIRTVKKAVNKKIQTKKNKIDKKNINKQNERGETPLIKAVLDKNAGEVERLLQSGAELNLQNKTGESALYLAIESKQLPIAKMIVHHSVSDEILHQISHKSHMTPLQLLLETGQEDFFKVIWQHYGTTDFLDKPTASYSETLLTWAIKQEDPQKREHYINILLNNFANPDAANRNKETPLYLAVYEEDLSLLNRLLQHESIVYPLEPVHISSTTYSLDVNNKNVLSTPLALAANRCDVALTKELLKLPGGKEHPTTAHSYEFSVIQELENKHTDWQESPCFQTTKLLLEERTGVSIQSYIFWLLVRNGSYPLIEMVIPYVSTIEYDRPVTQENLFSWLKEYLNSPGDRELKNSKKELLENHGFITK